MYSVRQIVITTHKQKQTKKPDFWKNQGKKGNQKKHFGADNEKKGQQSRQKKEIYANQSNI